ncbi:Glycosyl transferase family 9 [Pseudodesulfovibrio profundus]|uniref:Glycosyl transferase family 9 n=1 Tax=Pseudodesulfovibrio profundus TaxID=57320 RepID=A0A2C8F7M6_9BACT|nr:glycosyltransferase family 9 protein [Pseudodesulfovibrio profundus]SOB58391.1 Glycosyl transferase family 9 [Pseudodesulfovibrio profundus]
MSGKPILILQMQRMGDLILSYPLMIWLARRYPGQRIFVAAEESFYKPLMKLSPQVSYVPWAGSHVLKEHEYELVINLSIQEKAARLAHDVRAETKYGPIQSPSGVRTVQGDWQLYRTSLVRNNLYNRYHWAELNALDVIPYKDIAETKFDVPRTLPAESNKVGVFIGASEEAKRPSAEWSASFVTELLKRGLRPVLFGGPAEVELGKQVEQAAGIPLLNLCGRFGLDEFSAIGQTLALFITPDTGPMHLAAWTGLKCLNLSMGNVSPWETGPYTPGHFVLRSNIWCAKGCWQCTRSRLYCHDSFNPKRIAALVKRITAGDSVDKLSKLQLPDLDLSLSSKQDGLYHLQRLGDTGSDPEQRLSRFWQSFFGHRFGLWSVDKPHKAWESVASTTEESAASILTHIPEITRQFTHGLKTGYLHDDTFWSSSPAEVHPFTGYIHMMLENDNYEPHAWKTAMTHLEALISCCR